MKTELPDELLKALAEESRTLPGAAAAQARARRKNTRRQVSLALITSLLCVGVWFSQRTRTEVPKEMAHTVSPIKVEATIAAKDYVKVYRADEDIEPSAEASGTSEREKELFAKLPDLPVLIVKNDVGGIVDVHVFDR